ncbi:IPT/TIG domain-containing protein [Sphingobacterium sp. LRF_L2]|uniref:IPT/TIG domain-containing protein n=1 Tax=Sphingobacterium sp. LRF_L2 TaxID=3369421 RepID=UPI003F60D68D
MFAIIVTTLLTTSCKKETGGDENNNTAFQVDHFYPNSGKGGTLVTLEGDGFDNDRSKHRVTFNGIEADVLQSSQNEIIVRAPAEGSSGKIVLYKGANALEVGEYNYQSLSVQRITPQKAQIGSQIRVIGEGFGSLIAPITVKINAIEATVVSARDTVLLVEVPDGSGTGAVEVNLDDEDASGPLFTYMAIREMKPLTGGAGTRVTLTGEGFESLPEDNEVTFNGVRAQVLEASANQLLVVAPVDIASGPVVVSIDNEPVVGPIFTVVPFPSITVVTPLSGPAGTEMIIKGNYFSTVANENKVFINDTEVTLTSVTANEIRLNIPGGTGTGTLDVEVNNQRTVGPEFRDQNLGVLSFAPDNGLAGTQVLITGTGFSSNLAEHTVTFNGVRATVLGATSNTLTVEAPENFTTGSIKVSKDGFEAYGATPFYKAGVFSLGAGALSIASTGGALAVDDNDNLYVLEVNTQQIKRITASGQVSVFAGSGMQGNTDGEGQAASFRLDIYSGIVFDSKTQLLYLTDVGNQSLRAITLQGKVSTVIPTMGSVIGKLDVRSDGLLYILKSLNNTMWVVSPTLGTVESYSGGYTVAASRDRRPAVSPSGGIYNIYSTATTYLHRIVANAGGTRNLTFAGSTATGYIDGVGNVARFNQINGMDMLDAENMVLIDGLNFAVRKVNINTATVSTIVKGTEGFQDGDFRTAKFSNSVRDIAVNSNGSAIYVLDCGNNVVRKIQLR